MRTPVSRIERAVGAFVAAVVLLLAGAILAAVRHLDVSDLLEEGFVLYVAAADARGAAPGSPVHLRGVEVGTVTSVVLSADPAHPDAPVHLTLRLQRGAAPFLHDGTTAHLIEPPMGAGMPPFGAGVVELRSQGTGPLAARATIPAVAEDGMGRQLAVMTAEVGVMSERFAKLTDDMASTFAGIRRLTDVLLDPQAPAGRLLQDPELGRELSRLVSDARGTSADARRFLASMQGLTGKASGAVDDARDLSRSGKQVATKLDAALDSLPAMLASTERTLVLTEELVKSLKGAAAFAPELVRKVDSSLDETGRLVEAAQRSILLRPTLPDRPTVRTESDIRPPLGPRAPSSAGGGAP